MRSVTAAETHEAYTIRISKGAGLVAETRDLLREWHPGESAAALAERVRMRMQTVKIVYWEDDG
jgi:hypothetical protein